MKKILFSFLAAMICMISQAQTKIKISELPTSSATKIGDASWIPIVESGVTKKILGSKFKLTLDEIFAIQSDIATLTTNKTISLGTNTLSIGATNFPNTAGITISPTEIALQAALSGSTNLTVRSDSMIFQFKNGKANISPISGAGLRSTTDTNLFKPMVWSPTGGQWEYLTRWPQVDSRPYKIYVARLSQNSTSAPSAAVRENNLGDLGFGSGSWTREDVGVYTFTIVDAFESSGDVFIGTPNNHPTFIIEAATNGTDGFKVYTYNNGVPADNVLENCLIEIRRYL